MTDSRPDWTTTEGERARYLEKRIRAAEDTGFELKRIELSGNRVTAPRRDSMAREIAAFANSTSPRGGALVLGVDDRTREIIGIPVDRLQRVEDWIREICTESIEPEVVFETHAMELRTEAGEPRWVILVRVPRSSFVHQSPGGFYRRSGSAARKIPTDHLARLFQERSQARVIRFDEQPVSGVGFADLDQGLWTRFVSSNPTLRGNEAVAALLKRGILCRDHDGQIQASVAGVLMCSRRPDRWLRNAYIEAAAFRGDRQDGHRQLDARQFHGPLDIQVDLAMQFLHKNQRIGAVKTPHRLDIPQFMPHVVFEALVNAVAHRDYSVAFSKIRFFLFEHRMELYSPGALPNTLTVDTLETRQATRNELLTTLLAECPLPGESRDFGRRHYIEKRGDGVPIILNDSEELSGRRPTYEMLDDAELRLVIHAADGDTYRRVKGEPRPYG